MWFGEIFGAIDEERKKVGGHEGKKEGKKINESKG